MDKTHPLAQHYDHSVLLPLLSSCQIHIPSTMRLCNFRIPEECLVCYQMSQHNWVIIKMLYRCLRRCLLGWHSSRLEVVTPSIGEVSLGRIGNTHHKRVSKQLRSWTRGDVLQNDVMDKTHPLAQHNDRSVLLLLLSSCQIHIPWTMRLCNSRIPEEYLVCYQTSQHNRVIIKMLYRYLRRCLLGWHRSRLEFVNPSIREVSLGPLGNTHHKLASKRLRSQSRGDVLRND